MHTTLVYSTHPIPQSYHTFHATLVYDTSHTTSHILHHVSHIRLVNITHPYHTFYITHLYHTFYTTHHTIQHHICPTYTLTTHSVSHTSYNTLLHHTSHTTHVHYKSHTTYLQPHPYHTFHTIMVYITYSIQYILYYTICNIHHTPYHSIHTLTPHILHPYISTTHPSSHIYTIYPTSHIPQHTSTTHIPHHPVYTTHFILLYNTDSILYHRMPYILHHLFWATPFHTPYPNPPHSTMHILYHTILYHTSLPTTEHGCHIRLPCLVPHLWLAENKSYACGKCLSCPPDVDALKDQQREGRCRTTLPVIDRYHFAPFESCFLGANCENHR